MNDTQSDRGDITALLGAWEKGDPDALNRVITLVYHDLRRTAHFYLKGGQANATLQATALVHEVYQRLVRAKAFVFENRTHFFNCASLIMRQVLVRYARGKGSKNRDRVPLSEAEQTLEDFGIPDADTLLALDKALHGLATIDPRRHQIIELRYFIGLSLDEVARVLAVSPRTVRREGLTARRWLARAMGAGKAIE